MAKQEGEPQDEYYRRRLSRELLWKKKIKLEKQLAWPQHMCSLLKVRCYNHGQHGSSMTQMKGNIVQHIIDGLYEPNEAIVVGLTGFAREMVFAEDETLLYHLRKHGCGELDPLTPLKYHEYLRDKQCKTLHSSHVRPI